MSSSQIQAIISFRLLSFHRRILLQGFYSLFYCFVVHRLSTGLAARMGQEFGGYYYRTVDVQTHAYTRRQSALSLDENHQHADPTYLASVTITPILC